MKFRSDHNIIEVTVRRYAYDQPEIREDVEQYVNKGLIYEALHMLINQGDEPTDDPKIADVSLRDVFAVHALQGILAGGFADTVPHDDIDGDAAYFAYKYADEMLIERKK